MIALGVSLLATVLFSAAGLAHDPEPALDSNGDAGVASPDAHAQANAAQRHRALELGLWGAAFVAFVGFALAFLFFRREVRVEKDRLRRQRDRRALLREVRSYRTVLAGGPRQNT